MDYNSATTSSLWDFPQTPATFPQLGENDFLTLLQKQFNPDLTASNAYSTIPHESVDPSKITSLPAPAPPPPLSDDSSPSPPSINDNISSSRRQSTNSTADQDIHELKRKASVDDAFEDDSPSQKTSKKSPARRKSGTSQDESRLLKRKEQNRAAQRAFRERKEKHVKDLEDKVAELEAKNLSAETENQHLKELLKRLQDENVSLKNTSFTFSVPRNGEPSDGSFNGVAPSFAPSPTSVFTPTSHLPSPSSSVQTKSATPQSTSLDTPSAFPNDIDFGSLTSSFDPSSMNLLEDTDAIMSYDFGYGQVVPSKTPYRTIASAPMFMSFADPTAPEVNANSNGSTQSPNPSSGNPYDLTFGQWTGQTSSMERNGQSTLSLDELFGGHIFSAQSPVNFNVLIKSPATSPIISASSPVVHQSTHTPSAGPSSAGSPAFEASDGSSPAAGPSHSSETCPKTRAQMEQHIQAAGSSIFAPPPPAPEEKEPRNQVFRAPAGADGPMVMCQGATFPMTEKSDQNIEVLTAWRNITSHPHFKASNIDINELCSEFTDKARCDGTKVVLDPEGVNSILEKLTTRLKPSP